MEILDMDRFRQHSTVRVHPSSFGLNGIGMSHCFCTSPSDSRYSQLKGSSITFGSYLDQRSQQSKGDKKMHPWTERKPRAPEFNHKMTRKALWVDGWSTPGWVKAKANLMTHCRFQSHVTYCTRDWSQRTAERNDSRHMHDAGTTRETVAVLKDRLQRGINIDSHTIC